MKNNLKDYRLDLINLEIAEEAKFIVDFLKSNNYVSAHPILVSNFLGSKSLYFRCFFKNEFIGISGISFKTPTLAETVKSVIDKEFRGLGHGINISQMIENECILRGVKKIISTIYSDNLKMINIKLQQGYKIEGFHPDHEAPGFDEYSLGKIIT